MTDTKEKSKIGWNLENSYASLPKSFYTPVKPTPVTSPNLIILNHSLAESLGFDGQELEEKAAVSVFGGNRIPEGSYPIAQAYAGHQYGHFTMLGDGRAVLLGEQITPQGRRFDIQLKGSGPTPYSRGGDGRAALGPMLREYIISEAMFALGIPTTRSLAVVTTGEPVYRETKLPGAILTRVAASHIRIGTFEYAARLKDINSLKALTDYTIQRHFPHIATEKNPYLALLKEVVKGQAILIAKWMLVGFVHGVMNTDNVAISGETIDYGPCAFMDTYNPATVFSSIDRYCRYAFGNQPPIAEWNLARLADSLLPLLDDDEDVAIDLAQSAVSEFNSLYRKHWLSGMRNKLGLFNEEAEDQYLSEELLKLMEKHEADYTNTFLALTFGKYEGMELFKSPEFTQWQKRWQARLSRQEKTIEDSHQLMKNSNPAVIPRNHRVEEALDAAVNHGDYTVMQQLLEVLSKPYAHCPQQEEYSKLPKITNRPYRTFCGT